MTHPAISLDDKYDLSKKHIFLSGIQALVRLTFMQKAQDRMRGLHTAGYVTGYRGSPLGGVDQQFGKLAGVLKENDIVFQPGLNEDLAATAVWGSQQAEMRGDGAYDGVFSLWYGKGPGVDRSGDVMRHANVAGTSPNGGVLFLMGDDHNAESSTVPHQSEFALVDAMMPILNPAGVQEILDYGLYGLAMSRYTGCWVGLKCMHDIIESAAVIDGSLDRVQIKIPTDFEMPKGGLNIRPSDDRFEQERRLHLYKRFAAVAFCRANQLDKVIFSGGKTPKIGIVTTGKSYLDVRQALEDLGINEAKANRLGVSLLKIAVTWPVDPEMIREFSKGLDLLIVVEEKRSLIEVQVLEDLCNERERPMIVGKKDERGEHLFPAFGVLDPNSIAQSLGRYIVEKTGDEEVEQRLVALQSLVERTTSGKTLAARVPYFCAGCPHNSSTVIPEGARAYAGIGCHWMVQFMPSRHTEGATHMGGEGANWIGEAPFSKRQHVFQNLGDGTYNHSGLMAIKAACGAGVNITFKILYNDAVAMTGGQAHDAPLSVPMIAHQMRAEGIERIAVVSDDPYKYHQVSFPAQVTFHHRNDLQAVQQEMMEIKGVSILIYDQTCAAEKRRRRKRGLMEDPNQRVMINELVCEGCGDCGVQSNCVAIAPLETPFGRKRQIDQSACNKDFSCVRGFCPSFVTVEGGEFVKGLRTSSAQEVFEIPSTLSFLPPPSLPSLERPWSLMITGIGGTGVITVGHILAVAAHLEGKGAGLIDMVGLSQKNGAVVTHMKIAKRLEDLSTLRISAGGADVVLGCDLVTTASQKVLSTTLPERTAVVVNSHEVMPAQFTQDADFKIPSSLMHKQIVEHARPGQAWFVDATNLAVTLLGDSIAANLFTLGYAFQKGLIPLTADSIEQAILLNGVAVKMNQQAFLWGRRAAHNEEAVRTLLPSQKESKKRQETLEEILATREVFLTEYQNKAYAETYRAFIDFLVAEENKKIPGSQAFSKSAARYLFKLMAYKDEYEVARLHSSHAFAKTLQEKFKGNYRLKYHLAPPLFSARDPITGHLRKREFGSWMGSVFSVLAHFKFLRGTPFDLFGYTKERKEERALIEEYKASLCEILPLLNRDNLSLAVQIAEIPEHIRGYGHVKEEHLKQARKEWAQLIADFKSHAPLRTAA